jgi:chemotaxis protein MotA
MGLPYVIGQIMGWGLMFMACTAQGLDKFILFVDAASVFIVFGGSFAALFIAYPMGPLLKVHKYTMLTFTAKVREPLKAIEQIVALAEAARREGLLSLENHMEEIDNPSLAAGIRMAVDGMSPEVVESIMNTEMDAINARHEMGKSIYDNLAKNAPAFGMMGTLVGLVVMLSDLNPETVGAGMAVAIITTFYGALISNLVCLPFSEKLRIINDEEMMEMEITLKGVIAIQSGENPRVIKQKLLMYLPPNQRPVEEEGA